MYLVKFFFRVLGTYVTNDLLEKLFVVNFDLRICKIKN